MPAWNLEIIGTYAQTEMGHGNKFGSLSAHTYYYTTVDRHWVPCGLICCWAIFVEIKTGVMHNLYLLCYLDHGVPHEAVYSYHNGKKLEKV